MLLTLVAFEGMAGPLTLELVFPAGEPLTVTATSASQTAPLAPHAFTCKVCAPAAADIWAFIACAETTVVFELLSSEYPMVLTVCEEQVAAVAERANGDETVEPFAGVFTVTPADEVLVVDCAVTVRATSASHTVPFPHDLTCSVCFPVDAVTDARKEVLFTVAVFELLSSEYPIAVTVAEEQLDALATRVKGDVTEVPFAGLLTLMELELLTAGSTLAKVVTVSETSVTQAAPLLPHALTCSVCFPSEAVTLAVMELLSMTVVSVLLSRENPIVLTDCEEQLEPSA